MIVLWIFPVLLLFAVFSLFFQRWSLKKYSTNSICSSKFSLFAIAVNFSDRARHQKTILIPTSLQIHQPLINVHFVDSFLPLHSSLFRLVPGKPNDYHALYMSILTIFSWIFIIMYMFNQVILQIDVQQCYFNYFDS